MEVQLEAQVNFPTMSQSVVFNKENPTLVLCGGSRSAPRGTPTWALLPRSWTVFGGSSWGLSWRHFCVKETDESTEKIHGKSMTPRKKSMENSCHPFSNPQTHPRTPKFMTPTGAEVRPPRRPKGSRTPISTLGRPGAQVPLGPHWAPVALSTLLPQGRCFAYSDHGRAHVDHTFYKMDQLNESAQDSCCRGRRTRCTLNLYFKFFVVVMFSLAFC